MLLTQNPQRIDLGRHHRRHPASLSNITALPHPVPGLLSLSKPHKPQRLPSRLPQRPQSPRYPPRSRIHRPKTMDLPSDHARGRYQPPLQNRSPEQVHQSNTPTDNLSLPFPSVPNPPNQDSTHEPSTTVVQQPSGRLARIRRSHHKSTPTTAAALALSLDRSPSPPKQPQPSAPIAVPTNRRATSPAVHKILSRSDPLSKLSIRTDLAQHPKTSTRRDRRRRNKTKAALDGGPLPLAEWDFPAPGTSDDDREGDDDTDDREPSTPIHQTGSNDRAWSRALFEDGPKTAPLQSSTTSPSRTGQFPFFQFPPRSKTPAPAPTAIPTTPPSTRRRPDHRRAPSYPVSLGRNASAPAAPEAMFHLSEDEIENEALPAGADVREKMALLFGNGSNGAIPLFTSNGSPSPSPRKAHRSSVRRESMDGIARQLFASSSFQIAPEPVELPKPSFLVA